MGKYNILSTHVNFLIFFRTRLGGTLTPVRLKLDAFHRLIFVHLGALTENFIYPAERDPSGGAALDF